MDENNLQAAIKYHGTMLYQVLADIPVTATTDDEKHRLKVCKFIVKHKKEIFKPIEPKEVPTAESTIKTVPLEMFGMDKQDRRKLFFSTLKLGSVLIVQVINVTFPDFYKLKIICKHGEDRKLDDLSLVVFLPKEDGDQAEEEIALGQLLRVMVCTINIKKRMFIVYQENILGLALAEDIKLGKVSKTELPFYVGINFEKQSFVDILHGTPSFSSPSLYKELQKGFLIDPYRIYSLHTHLDGYEYPEETKAPALRKRQNHMESERRLQRALVCYKEKKDETKALELFRAALELDPDNVEVFVQRGIVHANARNIGLAIENLEKAIQLDPSHMQARSIISKLLVFAAKSHQDQKNTDAAKETLKCALDYDKNNELAIKALSKLSMEETEEIHNLQKKKQLIQERLLHEQDSSPQSSPSEDAGKSPQRDEHRRKCDMFLRAIRESTNYSTSIKKRPEHYEHDNRDRYGNRRHTSYRSSDRRYSPERRHGRYRSSSEHSRSKSPNRSKSPPRRY